MSVCWLLTSNWVLAGGECYRSRPDRSADWPHCRGLDTGCVDHRVFVQKAVLRGNWSLHVISRGGDSGSRAGGSEGTWLPSRRFLLTSQRAGWLLKINAPSTPKQRFFCSESLPEMNSHSFLEWTLWNPSFIMAGFQLVVLSEFLKIKTKPSL